MGDMTTTTPRTAPSAEPPPGRTFSGRGFVLACALGLSAFVAFLVFVSPVLLARTQAAAPPPAPHEVATGVVAGQPWTATAIERGTDEPCLEVVAGSTTTRVCTEPRGASLRAAEVVDVSGTVVLHGIVDARTTTVRLHFEDRDPVDLMPGYVDFGFPLGFFATALPHGATPTEVEALDGDGDRRGVVNCSGEGAGLRCENTETG